MIIYFENNSYKYEIESIVKLFCPLEKFGYVFDGDFVDEGDYVRAVVLDEKVYATVAIGESKDTKETLRSNIKYTDELELCRLIYTIFSELTGIKAEWGCLTGIRPVKKVNELYESGLSYDDISEHLAEKYYVSSNKSKLACLTAQTQKNAIETMQPNSYSLYLAIPFCPTRCSYCSFVSHSIQSPNAKKLVPEYVDMLCREIEQTGEILAHQNAICDTVYIGGGTPTSLNAEQLDRIMKCIKRNIDISHIREYTVEAGRADTITEDKLIAIRDNGATRISINPQTMNDSVLEAIGRKHTAKQTEDCFFLARKLGFDNINMDTIAGLPTDTAEGFAYTIDRLCELNPENITVHTLTVKRSSTLFKSADELREHCLDDIGVSKMVSRAFEKLVFEGYSPYYMYRQKNTVGNLENVGYSKPNKQGLYN